MRKTPQCRCLSLLSGFCHCIFSASERDCRYLWHGSSRTGVFRRALNSVPVMPHAYHCTWHSSQSVHGLFQSTMLILIPSIGNISYSNNPACCREEVIPGTFHFDRHDLSCIHSEPFRDSRWICPSSCRR